MSRSVKFPVAVHVLVALAHLRDGYVSSEVLGKSVDTNPVVVRRILQVLKKGGLVVSQGGVYGGTQLSRPAEEISLRDIYEVMEETEACKIHHPCDECHVGHTIQKVVPKILDEVEEARREHLARYTVADLLEQVEEYVRICKKESAA